MLIQNIHTNMAPLVTCTWRYSLLLQVTCCAACQLLQTYVCPQVTILTSMQPCRSYLRTLRRQAGRATCHEHVMLTTADVSAAHEGKGLRRIHQMYSLASIAEAV